MSSSAAGVLAVSTTEALAVSGKSASLIRDTLRLGSRASPSGRSFFRFRPRFVFTGVSASGVALRRLRLRLPFGFFSSVLFGTLHSSFLKVLIARRRFCGGRYRRLRAGGFNIEGGDIDLFFEFCIC